MCCLSQGHKPLYTNELQAEYNVTELSNGFTVLTESQVFPGAVNMGKWGQQDGGGTRATGVSLFLSI